jgi:hypothetical protein
MHVVYVLCDLQLIIIFNNALIFYCSSKVKWWLDPVLVRSPLQWYMILNVSKYYFLNLIIDL